MVEGHQCHRVAAAHRRLLLGRAFQARSPNGRFTEGAAAINAKPLQRIEVHGKNLFYFFGGSGASPAGSAGSGGGAGAAGGRAAPAVPAPERGPVVMHIHFGMSGAFRTCSLPGPDPTPTTRLELRNQEMGLVAHLSAMTVAHGSLALYRERAAKLGPDPLREDADKELLWSRLPRCKKPIGLVLMDQSMMAGVGNIYRAEILFKAGVHPETPACAVSREQFDRIWYHSVDLLQRGFLSGSIVTVDPEEAARLGRPWTRRYIYNQRMCGRCKGPVRTWLMAARTVYCCETCQPLGGQAGTAGTAEGTAEAGAAGAESGAEAAAAALVSPARRAAMAAARPARLFRSHCAPDDAEDAAMAPSKLTVKELRSRLLGLNLDTRGAKAQLVSRLEAALRWQQKPGQEQGQSEAEAGVKEEDVVVVEAEEESEESSEEDYILGPEGAAMAAAAAAAAAGPTAAPPAVGGSNVAHGGGSGGVDDGGSEDDVDRAERVLTESMAADAPGTCADRTLELPRLTVPQLRTRLRELGLQASGNKPELLQRLTRALAAASSGAAPGGEEAVALTAAAPPATPLPAGDLGGAATAAAAASPHTPDAPAAPRAPPARPRKAPRSAEQAAATEGGGTAAAAAPLTPAAGGACISQYDIQPGIRGLEGAMASAREAALEKMRAGENRAVEHVALEDDEALRLRNGAASTTDKGTGGSSAPAPAPGGARKRARAVAAALEAASEDGGVTGSEGMGGMGGGEGQRVRLGGGGGKAGAKAAAKRLVR